MTGERIAQIANFVGPTSGGLRRAVDALGRGYTEAGFERILIIPGPQDAISESESGWTLSIASPAVTGGYRLCLSPRKVCQALDRFKPTSVEVSDKWTMTVAALWARRHGVGSVLFSHERLDDMASMFMRMDVSTPVHVLNRRLARWYDRVVTTSQYSAGEWEGVDADLRIVPLGVDLERFTPDSENLSPDASVEATEGGRPLSLIYAGRLSREKSPHLAVATAVELDRRGIDLRMEVYGTGPHLDEVAMIAEGAPVFFHGYLDGRDALAASYRQADISLSVCPAETFGLAVLEALACGTPVVTSDQGGAREIVDETCGDWGEPDPVFLADAVERLWARLRTDRSGIRRAARRRAEAYPWSTPIATMIDLHREFL
ncbi:MAG: glycosyltransferase [Propionibacteriaceae bacterium]|jgi:alpha-1,6-mannosyltransferase|nr:glycosyltransferase [Propionibacteriaceae bacterium]